jgi:hypothetical protein
MSRPENYDWKKRWSKDLAQIIIHVAEAFRAIEDNDIEALDDAIGEIESLVESHA